MSEPIFHICFIILLAVIFQLSRAERRITSGQEVKSDNRFMVYLLGSTTAPAQYRGWICGGAIIGKEYVLTSAACVQDVQHMYVVAGYKKYVSTESMDQDPCVKEKKKKIILTCVPRNYQFDYNKTEVWAKVDIAVVKVESPFDFNDTSYETLCSYRPNSIEFNIEKGFPKPGDDVLVLGWGHSDIYRKDEDTLDFNQEILQYAGTQILNEDECVKYFARNKEVASFIKSSMLCTLKPGNLNDKGELIVRTLPGKGCIEDPLEPQQQLMGLANHKANCKELENGEFYAGLETAEEIIDYESLAGADIMNIDDDTRRQAEAEGDVELQPEPGTTPDDIASVNPDIRPDDVAPDDYVSANPSVELTEGPLTVSKEDNEKRPGICQNDHGGPLIAWRGGKEVIVGIASLFKVNKKHQCRGPFLFTKTWCNGAFLNCILDQSTNNTASRRICDDPAEVGFEMIRRQISWVGHKDGPAENEIISMRHQVPMSAFQP